jgi:2-polyprenyl-3-methyl-5-hydroxy-6-metoxy-1,4-benzoquinol methylase
MMISEAIRSSFDKAYSLSNNYFGSDVFKGLPDIANIFLGASNPQALDIGCGQGRDAIYLAYNGFIVTAVDLSPVAIEQLTYIAQLNKLQIIPMCQSITSISLDDNAYDIVLARTMLHHLHQRELPSLLDTIWSCTRHGGYFLASVFMQDTDSVEDCSMQSEFSDVTYHYFQKGELLAYLSRWKIHLYQEKKELDQTHGTPHYHASAKVIAKKV